MTDTSRQPIGIDDLCQLQTASDPQLSPDGRWVAYVRTRLDHDANKYRGQIWRVDTRTGEEHRFTTGKGRDTSPRWSPDGRRLAFLSDRAGGKPQLWLMEADGGEARQLTDLPNGVADPTWSPDGRRLAFTSKAGEAYKEEKTSEGETYKPPRVFRRNRYKADGEGFLDDTRRHIFTLDLEAAAGSGATAAERPEPRQLTDGDWDDLHPAWSPDGSLIAFSSNRTEDREYNTLGDIWVVPAEGGEPRQLTRSRGPAITPTFSPDGRLVAYIGHERAPMSSGVNQRVFVVPVDGSGETRCLTPDLDRSVGNLAMGDVRQGPQPQGPVWSPSADDDGAELYFPAGDRGDTPLWAAPLQSPTAVAAGEHGGVRQVVGGRRSCLSLSVARQTGQLAVLIADALNPGDVYLVDPRSGEERRLTAVNRELLAARELRAPEKFTYTGRDGNPLDGWLITPPGFDPAKRYPLMLKIHGGPHAMYGEAFFHEFQWYAGLGFVVLYTNPRGSQGYGEEHALCTRGDWGNKDYADVMAGVDAVVARGFIDERRMVVAGASYGGYLTSWIIGHTDRFRAALAERPVTNFYSFYGSSDIGFSFGAWETDGLPQRDLERYMKVSPISYVDNIKTPTLIVCGDADHRTPIEQSEQLYVNLHRNRVPVEFLRYPDEPHAHAMSGQPRHRTDRLHRIEAFLRRYLGSFEAV